MANWIPITVDTLNEASVAALVRACSTAAKAAGQADRAPGIIQGVIDDVRLRIASGGNRVDEDETTVPKGLRDLVVDLIIPRLKNVLKQPISEYETDQLDRHEKRLAAIARGAEPINSPDDPVEPEVEKGGGGAWGSREKFSMRTDG